MSYNGEEIMLWLEQSRYRRYGYIELPEWLLCWRLFEHVISRLVERI